MANIVKSVNQTARTKRKRAPKNILTNLATIKTSFQRHPTQNGTPIKSKIKIERQEKRNDIARRKDIGGKISIMMIDITTKSISDLARKQRNEKITKITNLQNHEKRPRKQEKTRKNQTMINLNKVCCPKSENDKLLLLEL